MISGSPEKLFGRTAWVIAAWSTEPKPEALKSRFLFSDGSALPFHQGTLRRKVLAAIVLCREHPEVPTAGLAPSSVLAKFFWLLTSF